MSVGKSIPRVDAVQKVTGQAKYTADLAPANALHAKIVHATVTHGLVKSIDGSEAEKVEGFVKLLTCFDAPRTCFPTAGPRGPSSRRIRISATGGFWTTMCAFTAITSPS